MRPAFPHAHVCLRWVRHTARGTADIAGVDYTAYEGDFKTRSGRQHFRPLKHWANERFEYSRGPESAIITQVVHLPPPDESAAKKKRPGRPRGRAPKAQILRPPTPEEDPEDGIDDNTNLTAIVQVYPREEEVSRRESSVSDYC